MQSDSQPQTLQQLLANIQLNCLNDPTAPVTGSQEDLIYRGFINNLAIPAWENQRDVLWNELWVPQPNYATLALTTTEVALQDDFVMIGGGFVQLTYPGGSALAPQVLPVPVKKLEESILNPYKNKREFYVSGNIVNGFTLGLGWIIQPGAAEIGATLSFPYYKHAAQLSNLTDVPEMSDPTFIMYKVSAAVARNNFNTTLYQINEDLANDAMGNMRTANAMGSNFMDDYIKDVDQLTGGSGSYLSGQYDAPPGVTVLPG